MILTYFKWFPIRILAATITWPLFPLRLYTEIMKDDNFFAFIIITKFWEGYGWWALKARIFEAFFFVRETSYRGACKYDEGSKDK
nr:hypothetical protein [Tanacetum cinerariifolium]